VIVSCSHCIGKFYRDHTDRTLRVDARQFAFEFFLDALDDLGPDFESLENSGFTVLLETLKTLLLHRWNFVVNVDVEELSGHGVNTPVLETAHTVIGLAFHHANNARLDFGCLKHLNLRLSVWEAVNDPSIDLAVTLLQTFVNKTHCDILWNFSGAFECFLNTCLDARVL